MSIAKLATGAGLIDLSVYAQYSFFKNAPRIGLLKAGALAGSLYLFTSGTAEKILGIKEKVPHKPLTSFQWCAKQITIIILSAPMFGAVSLVFGCNHSLKGTAKSFAIGYSLILGLGIAISSFH